MTLSTTEPVPPELIPEGPSSHRRLLVATLGLLLFVLIVFLLEKFRSILEPLSIGLFIVYLIIPIHTWLVRRGIPSVLAYVVILALLSLMLVGVGTLAYVNGRELGNRLPEYEARLEAMLREAIEGLNLDLPHEGRLLRDLPLGRYISSQQLMTALGTAAGTFFDFFTWLAVTFVYLLFLIVERETFPKRIRRAFGDQQGGHVLEVMQSINTAIARYISVKTLVSFLAGFASLVVLLIFDVDFAITWALLIFLFNFIPYIGSLVATTLPIVLTLVQLGLWQSIAVGVLLIAIQQIIGTLIEPRMTGQRLNVSPLLIVLSLAFWGLLWGIVGMILAVPMLVVLKIILDTIKETRPIATLISNM
jgi:predicted PurR-regulated permease PerM